ncbi:MAG: hypothetical protein WA584_11385 [Pyrinomonadaceae bacterium]
MKNIEILETPKLNKEDVTDRDSLNSPLEKSLESLNQITKKLNLLSSIILVLTFSNLIAIALALYDSPGYLDKGYSSTYKTSAMILLFFYWIPFLLVITAIYSYESKRKQGEVLFEEISDELEWHIKSDKTEAASTRPEINARVSLRSFFKTTDLPFVPGKFGPAFYLGFNIIITISISYLYFRFI